MFNFIVKILIVKKKRYIFILCLPSLHIQFVEYQKSPRSEPRKIVHIIKSVFKIKIRSSQAPQHVFFSIHSNNFNLNCNSINSMSVPSMRPGQPSCRCGIKNSLSDNAGNTPKAFVCAIP